MSSVNGVTLSHHTPVPLMLVYHQMLTYIIYLLQLFDYSIDSETHEFCKWSDIIPSYTGTPHVGIPSDAYVHYIFIAGV